MGIATVLLRSVFSFIVLLLLTRIMGKKQLSQLTFFNYITGITIGSIAAMSTLDNNVPFLTGLSALIFWTVLTLFVGWITLKSPKIRVVADGEPTIVIKKGKLEKEALQKSNLNLDDLSMMLRNKNVFSFQEVDYAILESNGKLSILKKSNHQSVTKEDLRIPISPAMYFPSEIITDGKLIKRNLKELGLSEAWVQAQLQQKGKKLKDVFFAEIQKDGTLYID